MNVPELETCIAWDSLNGGLAGISTKNGNLDLSWNLDTRPTVQPIVFPDTKELVSSLENDKDYLIVVDIQTGELLSSRCKRKISQRYVFILMNRDIFYCTTGTFARLLAIKLSSSPLGI